MKVLVTGWRHWDNRAAIRRELEKLPPGTIIVHGGARGADSIAGEIAKELGFETRVYPVTQEEWDTLGKVAGHKRNARMLEKEHPDQDGVYIDKGLAFHPKDLAKEKKGGTKHMVGLLIKSKISGTVFSR